MNLCLIILLASRMATCLHRHWLELDFSEQFRTPLRIRGPSVREYLLVRMGLGNRFWTIMTDNSYKFDQKIQNINHRRLLNNMFNPLVVATCEQLCKNSCLITLLASRMTDVWIDIGWHLNFVSNIVHLEVIRIPCEREPATSNGSHEAGVMNNEWACDCKTSSSAPY